MPDKHTKALEFFKDWSNYLLIATVAGVGWIAQEGGRSSEPSISAAVVLLAISAVFGIFTLALIPLVQEQRKPEQSNYDVEAEYVFLGKKRQRKLKSVCLWQHVFFVLGVLAYALPSLLSLVRLVRP